MGFLDPYDDSPKRDSRRAFTHSQRNEIWDRQGGKCAGCRNQLMRSSTHYDHVKPWEDGGKTMIGNGQALCPNCHARKSNRERLKKVESKPREREPDMLDIGRLPTMRLPTAKLPKGSLLGSSGTLNGPSLFDTPKRKKGKKRRDEGFGIWG